MYEKHEMDVIPYEANAYVVVSGIDGGDVDYNPWSIKPDRSDS